MLSGLCTKSTVIVGDDGTCAITKTYVDKETLRERIQKYNDSCDDDSCKLNITPEAIEILLRKEKGIDGIDNMDSFIEWSCKYGDE